MKYTSKLIFNCLAMFLLATSAAVQCQTLTELFANSAEVYELQRNELGIYRDSKVFSGDDLHPASVANIGMGLIQLCISDSMKWITDAEAKALITLKNITGHHPTFQPDRNQSGFYRHFIDMLTGERAWDSEYSTIDSGILTAGALFAKKYFCQNDSIAWYADLLWHSIDWSVAIADAETGGIYREMLATGEGKPGTVSLPFNEYMLVAYFARQQEGTTPGAANELWEKHYTDPASLPTIDYAGIALLTDNPDNYLSHFVIQFAYYLCHPFTVDGQYFEFMANARRADSTWWANAGGAKEYEWGLGAGSCPVPPNYCVYNLGHNPEQVYSPHIIAGFIPVHLPGADDLISLVVDGHSLYALPNVDQDDILWRKSLLAPAWSANEVQGVDFSGMLFGLAALPQHLGPDFFKTYNDFFNDTCQVTSSFQAAPPSDPFSFELYPNPATDEVQVFISGTYIGDISVEVYDGLGRRRYSSGFWKDKFVFSENFPPGILPRGCYYVSCKLGRRIFVKRLLVF